jgi:hypothetical protein
MDHKMYAVLLYTYVTILIFQVNLFLASSGIGKGIFNCNNFCLCEVCYLASGGDLPEAEFPEIKVWNTMQNMKY